MVFLILIHWIEIYPVDSAIQGLNNWGQLQISLLAQLARGLHSYGRGQGSNPGKPGFLQAFSSQLLKFHI